MSSGRPTRFADVLPLAVAAWLVFGVLSTFAARIPHPFDLEWMEGGMLVHGLRLSQGLPIYAEPDESWIAYVYPPGYSVFVGLVGRLAGGVDYAPARIVSVLGTLAACGALIRLGALRGSALLGAVGAAVFLGSYRASGAFMDLVRPDGLALGLTAWAIVFAADRRRGAPVAAGLLLAAAFTVKHHAAAYGLPLALALALRDGWRTGLRFGLVAAVPGLLFTGWMQARTDGRFLLYLLEVPASHPIDLPRIVPGVAIELGWWMLPSVLLGAGWLVSTVRWASVPTVARLVPAGFGAAVGGGLFALGDVAGVAHTPTWATTTCGVGLGLGLGTAALHLWSWRRPAPGFWFAFLLGGVVLVVGGLMRGHNGGFMNVLMPVHWALAAGTTVALADLRRRWPGAVADVAGSLLAVAPLGWALTRLELDNIVPTAEDVSGGQAVIEAIRGCPEGPVFSPYAPWLVQQAGREPGTHLIALWDIAHPTNPFQPDVARIREAARRHHWTCVVAFQKDRLGFGIDPQYQPRTTVTLPPRAMMGKTGWRVRPQLLLEPRVRPPPEPAPSPAPEPTP